MKFISTSQVARAWGISPRRVALLASQGRIEGAEFAGNTWLIPEYAQKPAAMSKGSSKAGRENKSHNIYPYPICVVHSDEQVKRFTPDEKELYRGSMLQEAAEFAESRKCAEALLNSGDRNVRLGALYQLVFDCMYQLDYEAADKYSVLFLSEYYASEEHSIEHKILLQSYEMEIGDASASLDSTDYADIPLYSADILPGIAIMKLYCETIKFSKGGAVPDTCTYGLICRQVEASGFFYSALHLNILLSALYGATDRPDYELYYAKKAVGIAAEHNIVSVLSSLLAYNPDVMNAALSEHDPLFVQKVLSVSKIMLQARAGFSVYRHKQHRYFILTAEDYRLISYCARNYSNDKMAELFGLSRSGMNRRLSNLYSKLNVSSKKEMLQGYFDFMYDWGK